MLFLIILSAKIAHADESAIKNIVLTWQGDPKTSQTITWQSLNKTVANYLYYRDNSSKPWLKVEAKVEEFNNDEGKVYINTVELNNLTSNMKYYYAIGNYSEILEEGTFKTADDKNPKFLVFCDSQSINYGTWQKTLNNAYYANPDSSFFVDIGDLVDIGQKYSQWKMFLENSKDINKKINLVPVVGNHETYAGDGTFVMPTYFTQQLKVPNNGPQALKGQVYSFEYGQIHFVVLDSQFGEEKNYVPDSLKIQKEWLERDLSNTDKPYKIVFLHRPPYHSSHGNILDISAQFIPIFDLYNVNLVFSGHEHVVAKTFPLKENKFNTFGTTYFICGRSGTKTYDNKEQKNYQEYFYNIIDQPTYFTVELINNAFQVKAFKQDGTLIEKSVIKVNNIE